MTNSLKDAVTLMDEVVKHPTLDEFMQRHGGGNPAMMSEADWPDLVEVLREERPRFIEKSTKKDKKDETDE
jgi:hypothetical protein